MVVTLGSDTPYCGADTGYLCIREPIAWVGFRVHLVLSDSVGTVCFVGWQHPSVSAWYRSVRVVKAHY